MKKNVIVCVDIGNSQSVIGIYREETIVEHWRLPTPLNTTSDEIFLRVRLLIHESSVDSAEITHIGLSSVVPSLERIWTKALGKFLSPKVEIVSSTNCLNIPIKYDVPKQIGADRICNVIAMREMGFEAAVAIDLGTATTFDILKAGGFFGGVILPGINAALEVLTNKAMQLRPVSLEWTETIISHNSEDSLRAGLLHGYLGQIKYLIQQIEKESQVENLKIIGTGGWGKTLGQQVDLFDSFEPFLTLKGIRRVALKEEF
jgi:type III pantothenate kinase